MVGVDEIENDVAIAAAARGVGRGVGANGLADIALNGGREKAAVARGGGRVGERHFLEFFVGLREGFAAFGDGLFQAETLALELACAVIHEEVESEDAKENHKTARVPGLPPGGYHGEGKFRGETESAACGAARDAEGVVAWRKSGIASLALGSLIEFIFETRQAIGAADTSRVAVSESREIHAEGIVAARSLRTVFTDTLARAELRGGNHDAWRKLDTFVAGDRVVAREAAAGAEEQGAVFFGEKALFAEIIPDEAIGLGVAESAAVAEKFGEAVGAAGPDVALVIGSQHVNVERRKPISQAKVSHLRFSIDEQ